MHSTAVWTSWCLLSLVICAGSVHAEETSVARPGVVRISDRPVPLADGKQQPADSANPKPRSSTKLTINGKRYRVIAGPDGQPKITEVFVLDLTPKTEPPSAPTKLGPELPEAMPVVEFLPAPGKQESPPPLSEEPVVSAEIESSEPAPFVIETGSETGPVLPLFPEEDISVTKSQSPFDGARIEKVDVADKPVLKDISEFLTIEDAPEYDPQVVVESDVVAEPVELMPEEPAVPEVVEASPAAPFMLDEELEEKAIAESSAEPLPVSEVSTATVLIEEGTEGNNIALAGLFKPMNQITLQEKKPEEPKPENLAEEMYAAYQPIEVFGSYDWLQFTDRSMYRTYHQPLYFEDPKLERCGNGWGVAQPFVSAGIFTGQALLLPYQMGSHHPDKKMWSLGDCPTCYTYPLEAYVPKPTVKNVAAQMVGTVGMIFLIP